RSLLHIGQERQYRPLEPLARRAGGDRVDDAAHDVLDLAVYDDGIQALLAAEVLVDDGLRDLGAGCELLDRGGFKAPRREDRAADLDALRATGGRGEPARAPRRSWHVDTLTTIA